MKISKYFNFENFSPDLLDTAKVKMFLRLMKQEYNYFLLAAYSTAFSKTRIL